VTTLLLVRHGLTRLTGPVLSGWTPGLHLDERGTAQAAGLAERIRPLKLAAIVTSPLERCLDTVAPIAAGRDLEIAVDDRLGEAHYGDWTGQEIKTLVRDPLWKVVQAQPSAVTFPNGEAMRDVQARSLAAIADWNARVGPDATWLACSHADVIKGIVADALGLHLDQFQRIAISPASLTVIRYGERSRAVVRVNDIGGAVDDLLPPKRRPRRTSAARGPGGSDTPRSGAAEAPADGIGGTSAHE
jgi:probable phosphomutase (TIGR03848 family)